VKVKLGLGESMPVEKFEAREPANGRRRTGHRSSRLREEIDLF